MEPTERYTEETILTLIASEDIKRRHLAVG